MTSRLNNTTRKKTPGAPTAASSAACGCGVGKESAAARGGVGPGAHAAGVDAELKAANLKHLRRIEGQVRGIAAMIEDDRYCADIIQQCAAVQESLRSVARNLYRNHLSHCASRAMHGDKAMQAAMVEELVGLVGKIAR
ncbi:MAG: metal-sensitive transcriptional regulator [Phycisphaerales bacterium]|nr:metal-sensitive transcriptional regulator [Phycisphaerales bacterium]